MVTIRLSEDSEIARLLRDASAGGEPLRLEIGDTTYTVRRDVDDFEARTGIWAGYDPERLLEGVEAAAGSWSDMDTDAIKEMIYRAREEGTRPDRRR